MSGITNIGILTGIGIFDSLGTSQYITYDGVRYLVWTLPDGTLLRKGVRLGFLVIDQTLTALGFGVGSVENTDWVNIDAKELPAEYWADTLYGTDDLALRIPEGARVGNVLTDSIDTANNPTILTPVLNITTANTIPASDSTSFRVTTESFIIEWFANVTDVVNYHIQQGSGTTASPGYMVTPTQLWLSSAASKFVAQNHLLNYEAQGWVHCMIVVDRAGFVDCYRNGIRTLHYSISASAAESLTNASLFYLVPQNGVNGSTALWSYYRMYKFAGAVPALDFAALSLSNYQTGDIHASLLPYCTHDYNFCKNIITNETSRFYNTITDDNVVLAVSGAMAAPVYNEYGSVYNLKYGYSKYWYEVDQTHIKREKILPVLRSGVAKVVVNTTDIALTTPPATVGYYWIEDIAGSLTGLNLADCKIRLVQAFFDRSNVTIWNDKARQTINYGILVLTGTSGTADITIHGLTKTATWATSLTVTLINFYTANKAAYKAIGVDIDFPGSLTSLYFKRDEGITNATIVNTSLTLNGTIATSGNYVATDPKAFHVSELNQRTLMSYLNVGYKGMFFTKGLSHYYGADYNGSVEPLERKSLKEFILYNTDKTGTAHRNILSYTGDLFAAVLDGLEPLYDVNDQVQLGYYKSTIAQMIVRLDDGIDGYFNWRNYFYNKGIRCVYSINTETIALNASYLAWDQVVQLYNEGFEIGNHTNNDANMQFESLATVQASIQACNALMVAHGIPASPIITIHQYGGLHLAARQWVLMNYRTMWFLRVPRSEEATQREIIEKDLIDSMSSYTGALFYDLTTAGGKTALKAQMDIAITGKRLISSFFHGWEQAEQDGLDECLDYFVAAGGVVKTMTQALDNCKYLLLD